MTLLVEYLNVGKVVGPPTMLCLSFLCQNCEKTQCRSDMMSGIDALVYSRVCLELGLYYVAKPLDILNVFVQKLS